jgi:DNA-directed RNA polymerase subunit RPC12/RpoP
MRRLPSLELDHTIEKQETMSAMPRAPLKRGDQIRCKDCGHRVLYKERTKR